jgi:hypothetical protein
MEPRFGHDFSRVRVHMDAQAAESARAVNALAYTVGRDVVFGPGKYAPATREGRKLLAHELAHVSQQGAEEAPSRGLAIGSPESWQEREAEKTATTCGTESAHKISTAFACPQVQRQLDAQKAGSGDFPTSAGKCHICQIPGGIGVCCLADNAPLVPECLELGKSIIDACKGPPASCLEQAQCAQCQCIGQKLGEQYCQCTGIV